MNSKIKHRIVWGIVIFFAIIWLIIAGAPFLFMVFSTFKSRTEFIKGGVFALPDHLTLDNYRMVFENGFFRYFINSLIVVSISLVLLLFISACASYPLSRMRFKLNKPIYALIIATMSVPIHVTLIPLFSASHAIGLYDSVWALIGPYIAFNLPISVFILTSFMAGIPKELDEAAEIDGCGKIATFFHVILPLSKSGLATLSIYNGVMMWNEFSFAMVLTQSRESRTLPLAVWDFQGQYAIDIPAIMTVLTLSAIPIIILYIIGQDKLVKGMMAGAVKG